MWLGLILLCVLTTRLDGLHPLAKFLICCAFLAGGAVYESREARREAALRPVDPPRFERTCSTSPVYNRAREMVATETRCSDGTFRRTPL